MQVIGFLHPASPETQTERLRAFRQGLKEGGYVEGENVAIEYRWADNQSDRFPVLAAELVRRRVAVIVAGNSSAAFAAKGATTTIPIVFGVGDNPVKIGLVASLARPGGNVTGVSNLINELGLKRLGLLRELVPSATAIATLVNPDFQDAESQLRDVEAAARSLGLQLIVLSASREREIDAAFATMAQQGGGALT